MLPLDHIKHRSNSGTIQASSSFSFHEWAYKHEGMTRCTKYVLSIGHLDAWSSERALARVGDCSWPSPGDCRGYCVFPSEEQKATLVDCTCHWATSLVARFLRCPSEDQVCATPLSRQTIKCWSTQWELACRQAREPKEKNLCIHLLWLIRFLPVIGLHYIDWFTCLYTAYKSSHPTLLFSHKLV